MIGKAEWFRRRKYTGWGYSPVTWQGWVYTMCIVLPLFVITHLPIAGEAQIALMVVWALLVGADFVHIATTLPKDERDRLHEAIAERNALWVIIAVLVAGIGYQTATGIVQGAMTVDPVIIAAVVAGLLAKAISNFYLDRKD